MSKNPDNPVKSKNHLAGAVNIGYQPDGIVSERLRKEQPKSGRNEPLKGEVSSLDNGVQLLGVTHNGANAIPMDGVQLLNVTHNGATAIPMDKTHI